MPFAQATRECLADVRPCLRHATQVADARRAVSLLGGGALSIQRVATLGPDGRPFTAVICPKQRPCGAAYPREAGTPKKEPL